MGRRSLVALVPLLIALPARAEGDSAFRLEYDPPPGCPDGGWLRTAVEGRLSRARLAETSELARTFRVTVSEREGRSTAKLAFKDADGQAATREVDAGSCEQALEAIAVVSAIAMDARAEREQTAAAASPVTTVEPSRPSQEATLASPTPTAPRRERRSPRHRFGVEGGVEHGYAPTLAPFAALLTDLDVRVLSFRGALAYSDSGPVEADSGSARYRKLTVREEVCPAAWAPKPALGLRPCALVEGGIVRAEGLESARIVEPRSTTVPWLSAGAVGRVELTPHPGLRFELAAGLRLPAFRHEFVLENPDASVHRVPAVTYTISLSVLLQTL